LQAVVVSFLEIPTYKRLEDGSDPADPSLVFHRDFGEKTLCELML
jgi:hypothetical protein